MKNGKHILLIIFSLIFVLSSVFVLKKGSFSEKKGNSVSFGYPVGFIEKSFDDNNLLNYYLIFNFKKDLPQVQFLFVNFFISFLIAFISLETFICILEIIDFKLRYFFCKLISKDKK